MLGATPITLPNEVAGIQIPNSRLAAGVLHFVDGVTPLWLMHHLLRSYVFAELLGRRSGMTYNSELLYLGAMMHDLGLTWDFAGSQRFELDGADAAAKFLIHRGMERERVNLVWQAIAFHTSRGLYDRMAPEIALVGLGALADATGIGTERLPAEKVQMILDTWPRHGFRDAFPRLIAEVMGSKPQTATDTFAADVLRDRGIAVPTVSEAMARAPF
jgi:hypothetical protein